ncbi:MAG: FG-GAP-like repeat-containing protein [Planctomycetaceae bacterium]
MDDSSTPSPATPPTTPTPKVMWILPATMIVIAAVILVVMFIYLRDHGPAGPVETGKGSERLSADAVATLLSQRDLAIGYLENHQFEQAEKVLVRIIRQVPDDPFGPRNLTICRELALEKIDAAREPERLTIAIEKAREAADSSAQLEPTSHIPLLLVARISVKARELEKAASALKRATELAPKSAPAWYDLFLLNPISPGEPIAPETANALRKVYELEGDNLFVLKDLLPLLVQTKDPSLADTVVKAKESLLPFAAVIKTSSRVDIVQMLDKLTAAATAGQWPAASSTAMVIRNVIVAEAARDERYVRLNSLEYVLLDFGPKFYAANEAQTPKDINPIPVKFTTNDKQKLSLAPRSMDIAVGDFDLNGTADGVSLADSKLTFSFPLVSIDDTPVMTTSTEIGEGLEKLLAIDLDDDADLKLKEVLKGHGCAVADLDIIVYGSRGLKAFENRPAAAGGSREFVNKPLGESMDELLQVQSVVPVDLDLDGDIDLLTISAGGIQLWSNRGNWSFEEITSRSKLPPASFGPTFAIVVDWDRDSDQDLLVSGTEGLGLLENVRHGRFRWRNLEGSFAELKNSQWLHVEQIGRNPSWSIFAGGPTGLRVVVTETTAEGLVSATKVIKVNESPSDRAISLDYDNDGIRDLLVLEKPLAGIYRGKSDGTLSLLAPASTGDLSGIQATAVADVDRDGDEDLILASADGVRWQMNEGGNANGWLDVALSAVQIKPNEQNYSRRVNHHAIGSMIEVRAGDRYQSQVVQGAITHFGLGPQKKADIIRVLWTNGMPQNVVSPNPNQLVCEEQKLAGSCPYLYTWDGEKFAFCTDLLWNAPLGLKFAENVVAPWREWEYLKIDGDLLRPKEGQYQLRVTAELWEVEYFDEFRLFAVDHPKGTDVFTNEKVGPASLAEHKIHTVSRPRLPVAAKDSRGRDLLDQVKSRDGQFTKTFENKLAQGLTEEHYLELDLGPWESSDNGKTPPRVMLYLTGWVYPGSTSLRVQHSQNPDLIQPRPPSLHAVDSQGQWKEVRPFMGFPGGKTKTIAVDISDVFAPGSTDHRLRIVSTMEFYWDAAFFTVDDSPVEYRQTELTLARADLVDRGGVSSRQWPDSGNGPDQFFYDRLIPGDMWPPISGAFTRFGDVQPLLTTRDDHLVVMHPGDEIQLAFNVPSDPIPDGWVRDFVIYSVGWDKDCDPNTVYGETSEPLPFQAMTVYAHRDGLARESDPEYIRYLKTYQTRTRPRAPFWKPSRQR